MTEEGDGEWAKSKETFNTYVGDQSSSSGSRVGLKVHSKRTSEYFDPCQDLASRSIRCIHRNAADKDLCSDYFQ